MSDQRFNCPNCGIPLKVITAGPNPHTAFQSTVANAIGKLPFVKPEPQSEPRPVQIHHRTKPVRTRTHEADVKIPFQLSLITALLVSLVLQILWNGWLHWPKPALGFPVSFILVLLIAWIFFTSENYNPVYSIEERLSYDLNQDGHVGAPPSPPQGGNTGGGRILINKPITQPTLNWTQLPAQQQVQDLYWFADLIYSRDRESLPWGQKALRPYNLELPSGLDLTDQIHGWMMEIMQEAGLAVQLANQQWRLLESGAYRKQLLEAIRAVQW